MEFIKLPNIPSKKVKVAVVDGRVSKNIEDSLSGQGIALVKTLKYPGIYEAIAYHPDIMLHHLGDNRIIYAPGTNMDLIEQLKDYGFIMLEGQRALLSDYPGNIAYNVARIGHFAIHNFSYTDPVLKYELERQEVQFIHVKQGYSKCSISIVDEHSIITSDKGIAKAAEKAGIDVLLIQTEESILLPGLSYGFIGGSTFNMDPENWAITGNIHTLKSADRIAAFLEHRGIKPCCLSENKVVDVGSVLPLLTL